MSDTQSDDDLESFMEVVTTYKCVLCEYTCPTTLEMARHARQVHKKIKSENKPKVANGPEQSPPTEIIQASSSLDQFQNHCANPNRMNQSAVDVALEGGDVAMEDGSSLETLVTVANNQIIQMDGFFNNSHQSYSNIVQTISENGTISDESGNVYTVQETLPGGQFVGVEKDGQMIINAMQGLKGDQYGSIQFVSQGENGELILQNSDEVQLDGSQTIQVLVQNSRMDDNLAVQSNQTDVLEQELDSYEAEHVTEEVMSNSERTSEQSVQVVDENEIEYDGKQEDLKSEVIQSTDEDLHFIIENMDNNEGHVTADECHVTTMSTATGPDKTDSAELQEDESQVYNQDNQPDDPEADTATKELYLCGNCSEGFTSIQDCKQHMLRDHDLAVTDLPGNGKVDMGTQMEPRKRAGRKKKTETLHTPKEDEEEDIAMSDSDEDWSEVLYSSGSTRSQRKRQPPPLLRMDYYLGRSKRREPKRREETGRNVRCEVKGCTARFTSEDMMARHRECHIPDAAPNGPQFRCTECDQAFLQWKITRFHLWKVHSVDMDLLSCDSCTTFKTDTLCKLKIHSEIHRDDKPYICATCDRTFKQMAQLKNHETTHNLDAESYTSRVNLADKWHTPKHCDICSRKFANAKCLKKHKESVHSDEKPYQCQHCPHACSRKAMLILHMRTHSGDKPFKCDLCTYKCSDHNSLRRHKMRHSGHKPYKCPHCTYACIQAISLKVHVKNKHPGMGGVYSCELCLYRSVNKQQYENHVLDHKNGLIHLVQTPEGSMMQKSANNARRIKGNAEHRAQIQPKFQTVSFQSDLLQALTSQSVQLQSVPNLQEPQVIQVPLSTVNNVDQITQLEMQVQMNEHGENVISAEDLAKLTSYEGQVHPDVNAAQLIYSALSAISQNSSGQPSMGGEMEVQTVQNNGDNQNGDILTSIQTDSKQGVTTHTITFHLPEGEELTGETTLSDQTEIPKEGVTIVEVAEGVTEWEGNTVSEIVPQVVEHALIQNI